MDKLAIFMQQAKPEIFNSACVMCEVPEQVQMLVCNIANSIDENEINLDEGGIEDQPHITVIYGVKDSINLENYFLEQFTIITDDKITYFDNDKFTVAKIAVFSDGLKRMHYDIKNNEENQHSYEYNPHITIAYLKPKTRLENHILPVFRWTQKDVVLRRNGLINSWEA